MTPNNVPLPIDESLLRRIVREEVSALLAPRRRHATVDATPVVERFLGAVERGATITAAELYARWLGTPESALVRPLTRAMFGRIAGRSTHMTRIKASTIRYERT